MKQTSPKSVSPTKTQQTFQKTFFDVNADHVLVICRQRSVLKTLNIFPQQTIRVFMCSLCWRQNIFPQQTARVFRFWFTLMCSKYWISLEGKKELMTTLAYVAANILCLKAPPKQTRNFTLKHRENVQIIPSEDFTCSSIFMQQKYYSASNLSSSWQIHASSLKPNILLGIKNLAGVNGISVMIQSMPFFTLINWEHY